MQDSITHEALGASDTRQALADAFAILQLGIDRPDWLAFSARFYRFLDAEAWTDAAMCLVPEGWLWGGHSDTEFYVYKRRPDMRGGYSRIIEATGPTPALALAQACLKARENADG